MSPMSRLILEVRTLYNVVVARGEALHKNEGLTLGMRAVLEYLRLNGPQTVPVIARARRVTRQRIQALVDQLLENGLVTRRQNPASQRSPLIALSKSGADTIRRFQRREEDFFKDAKINIPDHELTTLTDRLAEIRQHLE